MKSARVIASETSTSLATDFAGQGEPPSSAFAIGRDDFLLDGKPFRILSGALHYFRVHPDHWADRIHKARQMGLNTIETYVAWNAHSPTEDVSDFTGALDLGRFLDLVAAEGMRAVVRPGPYICAEWTNGGLPAWLFRDPDVGIRRDEPRFMAAVERYFHQLPPILVPRQIDQGGPIILIQVENEYGAYGNDKGYLQKLVDLNHEIGITVPLITVDQPVDDMLEDGGLPSLHKTGSFGSRIGQRLETLRRHQPSGPLMCSEFWDGWFDDWGGRHHVTPVGQTANDLDELLGRGASVNIYMFHGGTNFGFSNGANDKGTYEPITTSYDYDAPLDEGGNPTAKYWAYRDILARYGDVPDDEPTTARPAREFTTEVRQALPLWDVLPQLGRWTSHEGLPSTDSLGHYDGFTLYRAEVDAAAGATLRIEEVRDRAQVYFNRRPIGVLARDRLDSVVALPERARGVVEILVEDQGRVDYGPRLGEPKGLIGSAELDGEVLARWEAMPLDLSDIEPIAAALRVAEAVSDASAGGPVFARAVFASTGTDDLYLDTERMGKGVAWINGFCLGRFWSRGPQHTLYVPGPVLREGENELILLELDGPAVPAISFVATPNLGPTEL